MRKEVGLGEAVKVRRTLKCDAVTGAGRVAASPLASSELAKTVAALKSGPQVGTAGQHYVVEHVGVGVADCGKQINRWIR